MKQMIMAQRAYFQSGATLGIDARRLALRKLKEGIKRHESEIMEALRIDLGKSTTEAYMSEIASIYSDIDDAVKHLKRWTRAKHVSTPMAISPAQSKIIYCPYGVVLIMAPWNYPFLLSVAPLIGALAAGNCCIVKPSELAPATAQIVTKVLSESLDVRLVAVVNGDAEVGKSLLEERFDYIFYTGNGSVGRYVMERAARHLTPVTLELGGKSPVIVTRSANLRLAARRIAFGKLMNLGQTCVAPDYVLVEESVHDALVGYLKEEIVAMYGEHPLENPAYGKIINRRHFDRIGRLIEPQKVAFGGEADAEKLKIAPTILTEVSAEDAVMGEEIFGPVLPILKVRNVEEAMRFVQQRPHPLALYLFTSDKKVERNVMETLQFGGGCVNDTVVHLSNHKMPFGGIGDSGMGSYYGYHSFLTFSHAKSIVKSPTWIDPQIRYQPYTKLKDRLIRLFM
ncbi:MAG: aldehyde dehydrogenase [Bacteroidales bacterium]|nr:aldehyde dehydrogenase [Bacteroidales bacterium]